MDENQIGPNINTTPGQWDVRDGTYPSGYSYASTAQRWWIQSLVGLVYRTLGGIKSH